MKDLNKKPLIVLEMAKNHMGDVNHGKSLITALAEVAKPFRPKFDYAIKYQYRHASKLNKVNGEHQKSN